MIAVRTSHRRVGACTHASPRVLAGLVILLISICAGPVLGDDGSGSAETQNVVVATVDEEPVWAAEVTRLVTKVTRGQPATPAALTILQAQSLEELIDRRLVLAHARRNDEWPTDEQLQKAREEFNVRLAAQHRSLEEFLRVRSLTAAGLDRQFAWNIVWQKYLARYRTDARAESYFQAHRRQFDGTELAVSQILLRPSPDQPPAAAIADLLNRRKRFAQRSPRVRYPSPTPPENTRPRRARRTVAGWDGSDATGQWTRRFRRRRSRWRRTR